MRLSFLSLITSLLVAHTHALITLSSLTALSDVTVLSRLKIRHLVSSPSASSLGAQVVVGSPERRDLDSEIGEVLRELNGEFKRELDRGFDDEHNEANKTEGESGGSAECTEITAQHHAFMNATVWLVRDLFDLVPLIGGEKKEMEVGVREMQRTWASRSSNIQERSFIEQLLACYQNQAQTCFKKNEVLRRCVEVVEYLNDLIDAFQ